MFKDLFKKKEVAVIDRTTTSVNTVHVSSSYPKEVQEIHNEFFTAADKLVEKAQSIINEAQQRDVTKVNLLKSLGFNQAAEVATLQPLLDKATISKEMVDLIAYYKKHYPFNKFITEEQVQEICHKYYLVCGPVSRYKGFVPKNKLEQISQFKLRDEEQIENIVVFIEETGKIEKLDWSKVFNKNQVNYFINSYLKEGRAFTYLSGTVSNYADYPKYTKLVRLDLYKDENFLAQKELQIGLKICAPIKDMDLTGLSIKDGYKVHKVHIPDPIVLQPVKGGYLILAAWGDEASDPIVVNEINN